MSAGYFKVGRTKIELGAHVFALPGGHRRNLRLEAHDVPAELLDSGGGVLSLSVRAQRDRYNLGDAEKYAYNRLHQLALLGPGTLAFQDSRGYQHTFGDAFCVGGSATIYGLRFADMRLDFQCPEKLTEPAWSGAPGAPGLYAGTTTAQDYAAGGIPLGVGGTMEIEMMRSGEIREVPRARGARADVPVRGAIMRFTITAGRVADFTNLATDIENLTRTIGPRYVALTGNGNTFSDVLLESVRPTSTDAKHTLVAFEFTKEI
jgi:hypothetical protein